MSNITVTLALDLWPVVLGALEVLAKTKKKERRETAEAYILAVRAEVKRQVEAKKGGKS